MLLVGMLIGVSCDPLWRKNCTFQGSFLAQPGERSPSDIRANGEDRQIWTRDESSTDSRLLKNNDGVSEPEYRLPQTTLGAVLTPISLFVYQGISWFCQNRRLNMQGQYRANNVPARDLAGRDEFRPHAARLQPC